MIRNIRFYNSCFKFGCVNRVDENMINSYCSVLSDACRFMTGTMLWPNIILRKFCTFLFCSKSSRFILKSPAIITSFFRMSFVDSILSVFQILLCHHLVAYMSNLELCFLIFHLLFPDIMIQWYYNLLTNLV